MSPEDQALYGGAPGVHVRYQEDHHPPPKNDKLERYEQGQFASWCLLHNYPFCWHSTAHRSKATPGTPDFIVGISGQTLWIEFKRPGFGLSQDQEKFKARLEGQGIVYFLVYSHQEAIELTNRYYQPKLGITVELII